MTFPLEVSGLGKTYRRRDWLGRSRRTEALQGLDLTIRAGEVYGIVGPNGSGKSTTLKLALGLIFPTRGNVWVNGYPGGDARGRARLGYLPENPSLVPHLSPNALLKGAARVRGLSRKAAGENADRLLHRLGLDEVATQPIQQFSKGMAQRAGIGFAMAGNPEFLILDEPLSGLDPIWRHRVIKLLGEFRQEGGTILFSSHILSDVERLADRIGIFHRGQLLREAQPTDLLAERLQGFSLRFRGEDPPPGWGARAEGSGVWEADFSAEALWPALDTLRQTGLELLEVRPRGADLEDTFLEATGEENAELG